MRIPFCLVLFVWASFASAEDKSIDFDRDVQPILKLHCLSCHGEKEKGGLRLDSPKAALAGGNSGVVLRPGKSAESAMIHAVTSKDAEKVMPPGEAKKLSADEVGILRTWIDQGAKWGTTNATGTAKSSHWSFQPISKPSVPKGRNAIDFFIRERLAKERLTASPEADKPTLIRRISLDLIGLPPTPKEVEEFVSDPSPTAYEKLVDRLLASPHYGERWGRHWLDVVRYADYYQKNPKEHGSNDKFELHEAYRYRDWVVSAFNRDLPYDEFTTRPIAGDLLPNSKGVLPDMNSIVPTGFLSLGSWDHGDADKDKIVSDIVDDQIEVVGKAFLGVTLSCARCHDHKFDPISTEDYYAIA